MFDQFFFLSHYFYAILGLNSVIYTTFTYILAAHSWCNAHSEKYYTTFTINKHITNTLTFYSSEFLLIYKSK